MIQHVFCDLSNDYDRHLSIGPDR